MGRTVGFGPVGVAVANAAGTGANDKRMVLGRWTEAYLTTCYAVVPASSGPVWVVFQLRTASQVVAGLGEAGWMRGDPNFGGSDYWSFSGRVGLSPQGGNEVIPLIRNDSGAAVVVTIGGTIDIMKE